MSKAKSFWVGWKDSLILWTFFFVAWPASILVAFGYALPYTITAIVLVAILVQVLRGAIFLIAALGLSLFCGGIYGLAVLAGNKGQPIGSLNLVANDWTGVLLLLFLIFGFLFFVFGVIRRRRQTVR